MTERRGFKIQTKAGRTLVTRKGEALARQKGALGKAKGILLDFFNSTDDVESGLKQLC